MQHRAAEIIVKFPCCKNIDFKNLNLAQASVIELICNLEDAACEFNLNHALKHWTSKDLAAFWEVTKELYYEQLDTKGFCVI